MKTWKTITITALTTLALTTGGLFIYTSNQPSHYNGDTFKNEKVTSSSSKTSTSKTKESSSTSTSTTQESTSTSTAQESTPAEAVEPQQETVSSEPTDSTYVTDVDFRQFDTNHVFQWAMSGGRCFTVEYGDSNYPYQVVGYYKGYFITQDNDGMYDAFNVVDGQNACIPYATEDGVKGAIDTGKALS